ncbi:MAG TPA: prepilin peptidase [Candidatus Baltobacteraceae bacterium]|nr:prepilin peptidase [Candidatus Baltobacteraceae bacterium]
MTHTICIALLLAGVALAAASDLVSRRIPNVLVLAVAFVAIAASGIERGPLAVVVALLLGCAVLALGTVAFSMRILGGGDVKLIAALAAALTPLDALSFIFLTAACGALVALAYAAHRRRLRAVLTSVSHSAAATVQLRRHVAPAISGVRIPYAIAIAGGFVLILSLHAAHVALPAQGLL